MKIVSLTAFAALLCWAPAPLHAFTVVAPASFGSSSTALFAKAPSEKVEKAIQEAKAASEKYGAASPEARVAWDVVEELDAADNRCVCVWLVVSVHARVCQTTGEPDNGIHHV